MEQIKSAYKQQKEKKAYSKQANFTHKQSKSDLPSPVKIRKDTDKLLNFQLDNRKDLIHNIKQMFDLSKKQDSPRKKSSDLMMNAEESKSAKGLYLTNFSGFLNNNHHYTSNNMSQKYNINESSEFIYGSESNNLSQSHHTNPLVTANTFKIVPVTSTSFDHRRQVLINKTETTSLLKLENPIIQLPNAHIITNLKVPSQNMPPKKRQGHESSLRFNQNKSFSQRPSHQLQNSFYQNYSNINNAQNIQFLSMLNQNSSGSSISQENKKQIGFKNSKVIGSKSRAFTMPQKCVYNRKTQKLSLDKNHILRLLM